MAISIDWGTRVIFVPQADLTFVSGTLYALDTSVFRLDLKNLEDGQEGIPHPDTHAHNTQITIAGVTYARTIEIINGYTITFEDGQYAVRLDGSNNNIFDEGIINRNQVSIIPTNSAGLQIVSQGSGLSAGEQLQLDELHGQLSRSIYVDTTVVPIGDGYQQTPYNTLVLGIADANTNSIRKIHLRGTAAITTENLFGIEIFGQTMIGSSVTATNVSTDAGTQFHSTDVQGTFTSSVVFEGCLVRDVTVGTMLASNCLLGGTITMLLPPGSPSASEISQFVDCRDASINAPVFDFGSTTHTINMKDYVGAITLRNMSASDVADIGVTGQVTIEASCTGGTVTIKGIGTLVHNGSAAVAVDDENFIYDAGNNSFGGIG